MTAWRWIDLPVVLAIHERQIEEHGGPHGTRDLGLIESALGRPRALAAYGDPDVFDLAAACAWGIARNHGFIDGNKRTAYVVWRLFLELHDVSLTASSVDRVLIFENVAAGRISPDELAGWLRTHQRRL